MLTAVLFDLDNTLVDRDRAFRECVHEQFDDPAVQSELFQLDRGGRGDRKTLFEFWEQQTGTRMDQSRFGQLLAKKLQPDRDLLRAMHTLSSRMKLGIVTNGSGETQRQKIKAAGLAEVIPLERVWISAEVGTAKPDPAIFHLASRSLGESPANCLFVGDQEHDDAAGATAAGMRARLVKSVLNAERLNEVIREEEHAP